MGTKVLMVVLAVFLFAGVAFADSPSQASGDRRLDYMGLALGFGLAIAALAAAFSQSRAISTALESVARQPEAGGRIQTMMLIGVVFIETLVLFTWVLFLIWGGTLVK